VITIRASFYLLCLPGVAFVTDPELSGVVYGSKILYLSINVKLASHFTGDMDFACRNERKKSPKRRVIHACLYMERKKFLRGETERIR
jgi:hypothetical protein